MTLSFALKNLSIDTINLTFQNKLIEIALLINEEKFFDILVFLKIKLNEWNVFKYVLHAKFQSTLTRFAFEKIRLRYALIKITDLINRIVAYHLYIYESQIYIRVKNLMNNFNIIYNKRNFHVKNYVKLTAENFK